MRKSDWVAATLLLVTPGAACVPAPGGVGTRYCSGVLLVCVRCTPECTPVLEVITECRAAAPSPATAAALRKGKST